MFDRLFDYLRREKRRYIFLKALQAFAGGLFILGVSLQLCAIFYHLIQAFKISMLAAQIFTGAGVFLTVVVSVAIVVVQFRRSLRGATLAFVAKRLESQSPFFQEQSPKLKGELATAAEFLESRRGTFGSAEFEEGHIARVQGMMNAFQSRLRPSFALFGLMVLGALQITFSIQIVKYIRPSLPSSVMAWLPDHYEMRLPGGEEESENWTKQSGSISGMAGADVRFVPPPMGPLKTFLYVQETGNPTWMRVECKKYCEWKLRERGLYAIGTMFQRSSFFPLQASPDEAPRGIILVQEAGTQDYIPASTVEVLNKSHLDLQVNATDDVQLKSVELRHRFQDEDQLIQSWKLSGRLLKTPYQLKMEGWKGGRHEIYLRIRDYVQSFDSSSISILFADDETIREKRMQDLRALLDEWVHVLGDLLETDRDRQLSNMLLKRLDDMTYPDVEEGTLLAAYVRELKRLANRIERWAKFSPDFKESKNLVERTERQILYGLSLLFQEKTGEIAETSNSLRSSQADINKLLEQLKAGKTDLDPQVLEEAFKKLAEKLAELQKKIRDLPQGPEDELINREALEAQSQEADELAKRIEAIKDQLAKGDTKGALRELESLMNQLSILTKEMERAVDQWESNLQAGSVQQMQEYTKKLEEIKKSQEDLAKRTEEQKKNAEQYAKDYAYKPSDKKIEDALQKKYDSLKEEQMKIEQKMKQAGEDFERSLEGTEWKDVLRGDEAKDMESRITDRMGDAGKALNDREGVQAVTQQKEALDLLNQMMEKQKKMQDQMQSAGQNPTGNREENRSEKMEIIGSEGKGQRERKRKIMESLRQTVDEKYQKSHEQYFEDMLQR